MYFTHPSATSSKYAVLRKIFRARFHRLCTARGALMGTAFLLIPVLTQAQQVKIPAAIPPQDTIAAEINMEDYGDSVKLVPLLRPLRQVAGAPTSFYTYFWELGDGTFSFQKNPIHRYADTGTYQVRLYATNNYDDGKAPPTRPRPVKIKSKAGLPGKGWASNFFKEKGNIEMKINRNPRPGEEFVALVGYRNQYGENISGSLLFFFNEKQFKNEGFSLLERRGYHGEDSSSLGHIVARVEEGIQQNLYVKSGPDAGSAALYAGEAKAMLQLMQATYHKAEVLKFGETEQGKEHFLFINLNTLPEMIQDTNATVTMSVMLVPDNLSLPPEIFQLEMEVVASHDPNRLQLKRRRINYRFMGKKKELTYKVRFQNTGEGPAKTVKIGIAVPKQLNTQSLKIEATSPACTWCDSAYTGQSCIDTLRTPDSIYFVFKNIHLPGVQQEGVTDKDSTKGFVEYTIRFKKKPKKIPFDSRAAIYFDKNEPVFTNRATGKFIKGFSPGVMAGYTLPTTPGGRKVNGPLQLGLTLAPYAPARPYFQFEFHGGFLQEEKQSSAILPDRRDTSIGQDKYLVTGRQNSRIISSNTLNLVPLHYRYNLNNWLGIGVGAQWSVRISEQETIEKKVFLSASQQPDIVINTASSSKSGNTEWFSSWNAAPFVDVQVGKVKQGPAGGLRWMRPLKGHGSNWVLLYGVFRL